MLASQGCQSSSFSIFSGTSVINSFQTKMQGIDFHTDDASDPGIKSNSFSPIDDPTSTNASVQHASNLVFVNSGSCSGNSKENQNGLEERASNVVAEALIAPATTLLPSPHHRHVRREVGW